MIPVKTDDATQARYVRNILAAWHAADADQHARGRAWYRTANQLAALMSDGNARAGAGVLAALSPQVAWSYNIRLATDAFANQEARGHFGDACRKAGRIMAGEDPLTVLPTDSKTWNFFKCIADPDDWEAVVVDRHAHDIAVGEIYGNNDRGLGSKGRYAAIAHAYREAARVLGELPNVVQAVTWVAHVERDQ